MITNMRKSLFNDSHIGGAIVLVLIWILLVYGAFPTGPHRWSPTTHFMHVFWKPELGFLV